MASVSVGVFTGFVLGPAGLGLSSSWAIGTAVGAAAGATHAGLSGGNPFVGALVGGALGFIGGGGFSSAGPIFGPSGASGLGGIGLRTFVGTGAGGVSLSARAIAEIGAIFGGAIGSIFGGEGRGVNILLGKGFSLIVPTGGIEGSAGFVINPGIGDSRADIGIFSSLGTGAGLNLSTDTFFGLVKGDIGNVEDLTVNLNLTYGPFSLSTFYDPTSGETVGFTFGYGQSFIKPRLGGSITLGHTSVRSLQRDLIPLFRRTIQESSGQLLPAR